MIRIATPEDHQTLLQMWQSLNQLLPAFHQQPFGLPVEAQQQVLLSKTLANTLASDQATIWLFEHEQQAVATLAVVLNHQTGYAQPQSSVLFNLWVEQEHREKGYGEQLVNHAKQWLQAKGVTSVQAGWHPENRPAAHFWKKMGFSPYEQIAACSLTSAKSK